MGKGGTGAVDQEKIEEKLGKMIQSLDKGIHLETILQEEGGWVAILSKGSHSDRAELSQELLDGFLNRGEGEKALRQALGKVIGKLNQMAQKRR
jgi:ribosome-associated translation inhibitor RaiA